MSKRDPALLEEPFEFLKEHQGPGIFLPPGFIISGASIIVYM
jgi:hypothetical protein